VNAPSWLSTLISLLALAVAGYSLWRLLISRPFNRTTDYESDALHLLGGVAVAGLISQWAHTLPRALWTTLFVLGGVYFLVRAALVWDTPGGRRRPLGAAACCAVFLYMFAAGVAPSTLNGSTAGQFTMAGMPGMILDKTVTYPTIGLLFVVGIAFGAVLLVNRAGSMPSARPVPALGGPDDGAPLALAPRTALVCRVLLLLVMAYAILSRLV
jgi:Domain of unknown function (DUF5134)